ncbi:MAG: YihY/virulence factor BrkB family protein [Sandarakinorhabdus sp.]|nr:YihY/virulence factor BrkB family protein [Sandarakinorhabdus sp.]
MSPPGESAGEAGLRGFLVRLAERLPRTYAVGRRVLGNAIRDGYIHAGNIAYLSLVTLLPLVILITAVTVAVGQTDVGQAVIAGMLGALPADVAMLFQPVIAEVLVARTGNLLWFGAFVALWTVSSFIETLRDIIHRAFEVPLERHFMAYRLHSIGATLIAMLLLVIAFVAQLVMVLILKAVTPIMPEQLHLRDWIDWSRAITPVVIFLALWALFRTLAPRGYRHSPCWPGALITTLAWIGGTLLLGPAISGLNHLGLTYGALSGVVVALLFFYAVGFALVLGAELNAALAIHDAPS